MIDSFIRDVIVTNSVHQSHSRWWRLFADAHSWQKNQSGKQKQGNIVPNIDR